jgi:hypothetical protein
VSSWNGARRTPRTPQTEVGLQNFCQLSISVGSSRPDSSFNWLVSPLKAIKYFAKAHKWKIFKFVFFVLLVVTVFVAIYAFPQYTVKKVLGA